MHLLREADAGPRVLLKRLREIMAEPMEPQERLDRIVRQIAQNMVAEVCSAYVLRADGVLELYATVGLNPNAVHLSALRLGQGLVGTIASSARPLNLAEAQKHPAFEYLPETGEEVYNSFLGVPILRAGRTLGVLVVQNEAHRVYGEDEVEALETTAMVLGELIAAGDLKRLSTAGIELDLTRPVTSNGQALAEGIGLGHVILHEPRIVVTNLFNEDSDTEIERLASALSSLRLTIDDMLARREIAFEGEHRDVLESYRMFAHDKGWVRRLEEAIRNGLTAEASVEKVQSDMRARMSVVSDPYLRERMSDFDDLANRLLRQLMGRGPDALAEIRAFEAAGDYENPRYEELLIEQHYVHHVLRMPAEEWPEPVVRSFKHLNKHIYVMMQGPSEFGASGLLENWDRKADIHKITIPTLVTVAAHDTMDPEHMRWMAEEIPNARALDLPDGSHMAFYDDQDRYFDGVIQFLRDVDSGVFAAGN